MGSYHPFREPKTPIFHDYLDINKSPAGGYIKMALAEKWLKAIFPNIFCSLFVHAKIPLLNKFLIVLLLIRNWCNCVEKLEWELWQTRAV